MKRILCISFAVAVLASCNFLDQDPKVICQEKFYSNTGDVILGLASVYGPLNNLEIYGEYYSLDCSQTDDLCYFNRVNQTSFTNQYLHDATTPLIGKMWDAMYAGVRNANVFIEAVSKTSFDPDGSYVAEARFIRAYYYWLLAQCWGDVPLRETQTASYEDIYCEVTPQRKVLEWVTSEMENAIPMLPESLENAPSRVVRNTAKGILARVYLFMAGESVDGEPAVKHEYFGKAKNLCDEVIKSGRHSLNPSYSQVFINYISDVYDKTYNESMWEADFIGDRSTPSQWSNGRIGDLNGLLSSGGVNFSAYKCNFSYAMYSNTPKIWDLYWTTDRTDDEDQLDHVTDSRQDWNLPPYNYSGYTSSSYKMAPYGGSEFDVRDSLIGGIDKTPYHFVTTCTNDDPMFFVAGRNTGKFRREVCYEGQKTAKLLFTGINYPILRYSDVLLMYAEAVNEYEGGPTQDAYDCVKMVRTRAGVSTRDFSDYASQEGFRNFIRNERGRELCFESLRKYDLIRWGIFLDEMHGLIDQSQDPRWQAHGASTYAAAIGAAVKPKHVVLPIPSLELAVNTKIKQNPLWR